MTGHARRTAIVALALLVLASGIAPAVEPAAMAVDPAPSASLEPTPSPPPEPTPTPSLEPTPSPEPTPIPTPTPSTGIGTPESPMSSHLSGDVYGYLPYWEMSSAVVDYIDWNALSVIGLFSVTWTGTGGISRTEPGYAAITGSVGRAVVAAARARGVRVELTFTTFGFTKNETFFGDPARQATAIAELRALVLQVGADGVNVDAESIKGTWFDEYAAFVANLRAGLRADNPKATVSVATNANSSGAQMARLAADAGADRIFIMGYGYRTTSSSPGAIAPLAGRLSPGGLDIRWTIDRYLQEGVPLGRAILGLPYYGISWPTASDSLGAAKTGAGTTYTPRKQIGKPASLGVPLRYEPGESVSWYAWYDGEADTWRQAFFDTPTSLGPKYAYAITRRLAGVGIWALGYDRGVDGYWGLLKTMFGPPRVTGLSLSPSPTRWLTVNASVSPTAGSRAVTHVQFGHDGKRWGAWQVLPPPTTDPSGITVPATFVVSLGSSTTEGTRAIWAQVRDEGGTISAPRSATAILDRTGPDLPSAPTLWFSPTTGTWRARWTAARDPSRPVTYKVWYAVGGGAWKVLVTRTSATSVGLPVTRRTTRVAVLVRAIDALGNGGPTRSARR